MHARMPAWLHVHAQVLGPNRVIYALKRVRLQNKDTEAIKGFIDEIGLLRQLRARSNIIQLIDAQARERRRALHAACCTLWCGVVWCPRLFVGSQRACQAVLGTPCLSSELARRRLWRDGFFCSALLVRGVCVQAGRQG